MAAVERQSVFRGLKVEADVIAAAVLDAGLGTLTPEQSACFEVYLGLLLKWNERLNLTSVRDAAGIVSRHFTESIQCARALPLEVGEFLDYGSGAGFPGVPCAICMPRASWTFAESQGKKAAFLQEVVRALGLAATVHAGRVESLVKRVRFDAVALRAVDRMEDACLAASRRLRPGGWLAVLTTEKELSVLRNSQARLAWQEPLLLVGSSQRVLLLGQTLVEDEAGQFG